MQENHQARRGTLGWIGQALFGILLLTLPGLNMISHHFVVEGGLRDYAQVLNYVGGPLVLATGLAFMVMVAYHALAGARLILFDLGLKPSQERFVTRTLVIIGVLTVGYGFWLAFALFSRT